jgi:hypothetical protein
MNSAEDTIQIRFMHDRMLAAQYGGWDDQRTLEEAHAMRMVKAKWTRISRMSKVPSLAGQSLRHVTDGP